MLNQFSRTELLLGRDAMEKMAQASVAIFGIGGVGSYTAEALARSGIGSFDLIDDDKVCLTNINRQLIATRKTVGQNKVEVMKQRILDINPNAQVNTHQCFFLPENADKFDFSSYSYVVDAIDTISAKIELVLQTENTKTPIISCMGAGNKLDPTLFKVADIYKTSMCPVAKIMRKELKKRRIKHLKVVFSTEEPIKQIENLANSCQSNCICPPGTERKCTDRRSIPGSISFVPSVAGLILAGEVIKDLAFQINHSGEGKLR
ncbi:tRNA threonylcarbamoyladenosine dehydratase [Acetobacterium malicum]|jgi:tRNA A37 threonylcarbamoyladenosine dehydratase|uniref:tRNA threonylcarbamoyladenosine dehydratase n=1 Tax=Acetobacterium malicum TaxID=52692 RepID=A0ABR6YSJ4_9FIRM|nr:MULTISPECIES: tRNA threonylcarbamoyladenosine dehydratase [Acetobacterium]MBC3898155.1 tRNA threonylcarbamoyladenosine dehydratase [Acetobacterium malicum]PKM53220.1 MAG: tRNA threonylcarbamoyladenosine dehydratase [Firmicutes bacterium HGW-Firmicutes-5]PKM87391.1 MAG: tRNA threonylcarbamoyladenosine dehydratase [Firmicutes bacterium HGW-Firmicutes-10]